MTAKNSLEAFIPLRRTDVINLCIDDGQLNPEQATAFRELCEMITAFYHFRFHQSLELFKDNYLIFDPHTEIKPYIEPELEQYEQMKANVFSAFQSVLARTNYRKLSIEKIKHALDKKSLINLKTEIDFDDFDDLYCYYRGNTSRTIEQKKFFFWNTQKQIDVFERIVLLIGFKGKGYFEAKEASKKSKDELNFTPGKIYLYFYKNIPQLDIDLLFPNLKSSMTLKDKLLFGIPAIGAAIPLLLKTLPNLLVVFVAILFALNLRDPSLIQSIDVDHNKARNIMPVLVATLSLGMAFGGFAMQQYNQYKSKQVKFQKNVTDTLFFKNLANHSSAFQLLVDIAEEEECKEVILAYYHLLTSPQPLTPQQLDSKIEQWMEEKAQIKINFDIQGPLQNLAEIRGKITNDGSDEQDQSLIPLLSYDAYGYCQVLPLTQARILIDYVWDHIFEFNEN